MDNAVALVRAYLQLNGYFTITEYPVVRKLESGGFRTLTEIDVAALHLPSGEPDFEPDPALQVPRDKADLIIGEVKEGRAVINEAATDPSAGESSWDAPVSRLGRILRFLTRAAPDSAATASSSAPTRTSPRRGKARGAAPRSSGNARTRR